MKKFTPALLLAFLALLGCFAQAGEPAREFEYPVMGPSRLAFDSNPAYLNDHSLIQGPDGQWHLIGITHRKVLGGALPVPWAEDYFAHAVAPDLDSDFHALPPILPVDQSLGETHVWAPHLVFHDGLYYCFYAGGGKDHWQSRIDLATSPDLMTWTRHPDNPLFLDFYDARDPMVLPVGGRWVMYYTKTYSRERHYSTVAYRTSDDLIHWSDADFALVLKKLHTDFPNSGHTESPFVVEKNGLYYLFICTPDLGYRCTRVFVSRDPLHFEEDDEIAVLPAHCAEVIRDGDRWLLSHAGWFYDGVYLAPLEWRSARAMVETVYTADSGENRDFLVESSRAFPVKPGLTKALRVMAGGKIVYRFPVTAGTSRVGVALEESGGLRVTSEQGAGDRVLMEEDGKGRERPQVHALELDDPGQWPDGMLTLTLEPVSGAADVYYVKVFPR